MDSCFSWGMILYQGLINDLCWWQVGHSEVAVVWSVLVNGDPCCWVHAYPPSLLPWLLLSCTRCARTGVTHDRDWLTLAWVILSTWFSVSCSVANVLWWALPCHVTITTNDGWVYYSPTQVMRGNIVRRGKSFHKAELWEVHLPVHFVRKWKWPMVRIHMDSGEVVNALVGRSGTRRRKIDRSRIRRSREEVCG